MRRKQKHLGQNVGAVDPMGELARVGLGHLRVRINPLMEADPDKPGYYEKMQALGEACVIARPNDRDSHWNEGSKTIIAGFCDFVRRHPKFADEDRHLGTMRDLLIDNAGLDIDAMMELGGASRAAAALLDGAADDERSSLRSTSMRHTAWLDSDGMREVLSASDVRLADLPRGQMSLFIVLPPHMMEQHARFLRLAVTGSIDAVMTGAVDRKNGEKTLFLLDETYSLGPLEALERAMSVGRGYGMKLWTVWQGLTQIQELYPKNYQTFLANSGQNQVFATNDMTTMAHFADRLGRNIRFRRVRTKEGYEWQPGSPSLLRTGEELARTTSRDSGQQMVFVEGGDTFLLRRMHYDDMFRKGSYAPDPYESHRKRSVWRRVRDLIDDLQTSLEKADVL